MSEPLKSSEIFCVGISDLDGSHDLDVSHDLGDWC